ncbi:hypothetical protein O181_083160 [Austropuccinia psidii MF-1]|uniref:Uncharacterized protein n=1 Tax=Austropuccinia psidii MF-1 TaxID=1389203 RepID=A0A9Q3ILF5_9BASI|nr:hypothetical protein [Austropuccinia psidii MF-1]
MISPLGVSFTPSQYKHHIKNLKPAIAHKYLPNIPPSASGSECRQSLLDQIFPADYSQLTQSTFSTPLGLTSTAHKPYSGSPNLPPQDLGMIMSTILLVRYNIPCRASHILNPSLNLRIKSRISSSGFHPTPALHIPQDLITISEHLQLEPVIPNYICCPQCSFLNGFTESVTIDQPHCQCHIDPNSIHLIPTPKAQSTSKKIHPKKTFHLSTIQKFACQISPAG